ncbi:MAG: ribonuclease P protein component [Desulfovibrionaceae bacterium]
MLSKKYRILKRQEFLHCYTFGKKYIAKNLIFFIQEGDFETWRVGITASKKMGNAVVRNRFKRVVRAAFFLSSSAFNKNFDCIVVAKKSYVYKQMSSCTVQEDLLPLFERLGIL